MTALPGAASSPGNKIAGLLPGYMDYLAQKNFSALTMAGRRNELLPFVKYCAERAVTEPSQITVSLIDRYTKYVTGRISNVTGKKLRPSTQIHFLSSVRDYLRFLVKRGHMLFNPALEVELPRMGHMLPRNVLTQDEAERIMMVPDIFDPLGLRSRALLEVLYSTGVRRSELARMDITDVDFAAGTIFVREGKGQKDRVVPVGARALSWVQKYLNDVRPALLAGRIDDGALFLNVQGTRLGVEMVTETVTTARKKAGVEKQGSAHMLRHTAATLMLENGADVRYVQELLGHEELTSTQRYTHVAIRKLKEVHEKTHPAKFRKVNLHENKEAAE